MKERFNEEKFFMEQRLSFVERKNGLSCRDSIDEEKYFQ